MTDRTTRRSLLAAARTGVAALAGCLRLSGGNPTTVPLTLTVSQSVLDSPAGSGCRCTTLPSMWTRFSTASSPPDRLTVPHPPRNHHVPATATLTEPPLPRNYYHHGTTTPLPPVTPTTLLQTATEPTAVGELLRAVVTTVVASVLLFSGLLFLRRVGLAPESELSSVYAPRRESDRDSRDRLGSVLFWLVLFGSLFVAFAVVDWLL